MEKIDGITFDRLSLLVKAELVPIFFQLLGHGFKVNVQTGCSIKELLCNQLGIDEDYLSERIQTIFLNFKVVDDVNSAIVNEGSVLALSGAMPGLVGAILRSGGYYAAMRSQISHKKNPTSRPQGTAPITLKLLNLIVKELGPTFLQNGIILKGEQLQEFIESRLEDLKIKCLAVEFNDKPVEIDSFRKVDWKTKLVFLQVKSEQAV
jgi:hypothetical protein